jgi:hypothetical protein
MNQSQRISYFYRSAKESSFLDSIRTKPIFRLSHAIHFSIWSDTQTQCENEIKEITETLNSLLIFIENNLHYELPKKPDVCIFQDDIYGIVLTDGMPICIPWRINWKLKANLWHYIHEVTEINLLNTIPYCPRWYKEGMAQLIAFLAMQNEFGIQETNQLVAEYYGLVIANVNELLNWAANTKPITLKEGSLKNLDRFLQNQINVNHVTEQPWYHGILKLFVLWHSNRFNFCDSKEVVKHSKQPENLFLEWCSKYGRY